MPGLNSRRPARPLAVAALAALLAAPLAGSVPLAAADPPQVSTGTSATADPPQVTAGASAAAVRTCAAAAASMSVSEQVGQLMMVAISSTGMSSGQARTLSKLHIGSVLLLGNSTAGRASTRRLTQRVHGLAGKPRGVSIMVAVDQEGGTVQRLRGPGFDRIPAARDQAKLSTSQLTSKAQRWAGQLRAAGVDVNLAPVADVVPASMERVNQPVGVLRRGYGPNPDVVASKVPAFVTGMHRGGVVVAVKHFPGLGRVRGNTDFVQKVVDRSTTRHDRALKGFAAGMRGGVDMVMISSAYYTKIDGRRRAVFSPVVMKSMLRSDFRYSGVIISDDLTAPGFRDYTPGKRAVTFLEAGGDLLIAGDSSQAASMASAVRARAAKNPAFRAELTKKVTRVLQVKARRGLASCR